MTTAADYQALAAEAMRDTLRAQGVTEQVRMRGLTVPMPMAHKRDRLGFCYPCGARNGEPHNTPERTGTP